MTDTAQPAAATSMKNLIVAALRRSMKNADCPNDEAADQAARDRGRHLVLGKKPDLVVDVTAEKQNDDTDDQDILRPEFEDCHFRIFNRGFFPHSCGLMGLHPSPPDRPASRPDRRLLDGRCAC